MMKSIKLFAVVAVLVAVFVGGMGAVSYKLIMDVLNPQEVKAEQPEVQVGTIEENGYVVLEGDNNPDESTIVAEVEDNDADGDGYVMALNVFDDHDEVAINKMDLRKGDVVLITFYNDDVVKVKKNDLNIAYTVAGQKVLKNNF